MAVVRRRRLVGGIDPARPAAIRACERCFLFSHALVFNRRNGVGHVSLQPLIPEARAVRNATLVCTISRLSVMSSTSSMKFFYTRHSARSSGRRCPGASPGAQRFQSNTEKPHADRQPGHGAHIGRNALINALISGGPPARKPKKTIRHERRSAATSALLGRRAHFMQNASSVW